jgi:hypothetical protein
MFSCFSSTPSAFQRTHCSCYKKCVRRKTMANVNISTRVYSLTHSHRVIICREIIIIIIIIITSNRNFHALLHDFFNCPSFFLEHVKLELHLNAAIWQYYVVRVLSARCSTVSSASAPIWHKTYLLCYMFAVQLVLRHQPFSHGQPGCDVLANPDHGYCTQETIHSLKLSRRLHSTKSFRPDSLSRWLAYSFSS